MASIMMMLFLFSIFYKGICIFLYSHSRNYNFKLPRRIVFIHQSSTFSNLNLIILSGFIVLFSVSSSAWAENTSRIELTREEQAWLDRHPNIILGTTTKYPPMVIKKEDGIHIGILVDLFEQINQRLNTKIRLEFGNWVDIQDKAQQQKLDGLAMGTVSLGRNTLYNSTDVILTTYSSVFARTNNEYQLKKLSDLKGLRVGYKKGAQAAISILEKHAENLKIPYDTHESMTQALLSRDIDVIVAWMSYDHWRKDKLQGVIDNIFIIEEYPLEMVTYIRKDWPELIPILNKAIKSIHQKEMPRNTNKWFGQWPKYHSVRANLTLEEQVWLENNHTVRVSVGDIPPWSINSPVPQGMSVEYLKIIGEQFGINFKFISDYHQKDEPFKDIAVEHSNFDLYPTVQNTPERKEMLSMSDNYLESPSVIFTRDKTVDIFNIEDLRGRKVSVERGQVMQNQLKTEVNGIQLIIKENTQKALIALSTGEVDAYVGSLIVTSHLLQRLGVTNIKVSSPTSFGVEQQAMATRQEWSPLISIINKGLANITEAQKMSIRNEYIPIHYVHGITSREVLKWGLFLIIFVSGIIILFVLWNRTLKQRVTQRTNELSESESRFRSIFEQAAVGIAHVSIDGQFLRLNKKFCEIVGYSEEELIKKHF
ncbi:MAG: transporter substrate-binding domain-containing protein, partial [Desulfobacterales bacterium]|nr:transporter substrate-binding domain-containing protein [Desulfobacterales bacterium]